ncbi:histidine phosphatase family protein [Rhizobium sp. 18055]|uniref:SixA phosphatase family protein n=1 Tax=Rhizobium sp. 18055 TaxID=2681403 RepID=UPI00135988D3|nr:histidine phosphatase family protein [Rhizobium sp. 18055]
MTAETNLPKRRLMLLRHAKSAWPDGVADHDRPLSERGLKAAPRMGAYIASEGLMPDLALVSTSRRTQQTWRRIKRELPASIEQRDLDDLYEAPAARLAALLHAMDPSVRTLLLIGHNPGFHDLALGLVGSGDREIRTRLDEKFPTGALVVIDFEAHFWDDVRPRSGVLERFVVPRSLR